MNRRNSIRRRNTPDERIRLLERALADDPSDIHTHAQLIIEKMRVGRINDANVLMAARLGYEPARLVEPKYKYFESISWHSTYYRRQAISLIEDDRKIVAYAADCAEHIIYAWIRLRPHDNRPQLALAAIREWIQSPTEEARQIVGNIAVERALIIEEAEAYRIAPGWQESIQAVRSCFTAAMAAAADNRNRYDRTINICERAETAVFHAMGAANNRRAEITWQVDRLCKYLLDEVKIT